MTESLYRWFHPTIDAILTPSITLGTRFRLLCLQPLALLVYALKSWHKFSFQDPEYRTIYIPTRQLGSSRRCLIYNARPEITHLSRTQGDSEADYLGPLKPLHLDIHGGAFISGMPESDHEFNSLLAERTGAVVVSASYRFAPRSPFPAAIDDFDDILAWLIDNARSNLGADPDLLTVSGFSAGGNLALAACQSAAANRTGECLVKGAVTFYASVSAITYDSSLLKVILTHVQIDLRIPPRAKPRPTGFPKYDPVGSFFEPLFDAYPGPARATSKEDPRLSPILAPLDALPGSILLIIPKIDILLHEQESFVSRVGDDIKESNTKQPARRERKIQTMFIEGGFHGWLECMSWSFPA